MLLTNTARPRCLLCALRQQIRHATLIRRPKRPYTFTQLITLSDGSTFTHRTTSPQPIYRSTKDTKNTALWNPSSQKLLNVEEDEAGRLKRFRKRFGRGFDAEAAESEDGADVSIYTHLRILLYNVRIEITRTDAPTMKGQATTDSSTADQEEENLLDLISGFGFAGEKQGSAAGVREEKRRSGKGKGGEV